MTFIHRLSLFACLISAPLLASCNNESPSDIALAPAPLNSSNKLEVFPQENPADSTQKLLEIREWKFKVDIPQPHKHLLYILEVREKDKKPRVINRAILGVTEGAQRRELTLAMLPLNFDWAKSKRLKKQFVLDGSIASGEMENPFKACTGLSMGKAESLPGGSFLLMEGNTPGYSSPLGGGQGQIILVLKLQSGSSPEALLAAS